LVLAIGLVRVEEGVITQQEYSLIRPPTQIFEFTEIHGLSWADVSKAPSFGHLWTIISPVFTNIDFLAAHHAAFDREVLQACWDFYQIDRLNITALTVKLARQQWNIYPTKLPNVCQQLGIDLNHHHALSDAQACAQIVLRARSNNLPKSFIN
jgi:DNA polymerase III subunit epsilon